MPEAPAPPPGAAQGPPARARGLPRRRHLEAQPRLRHQDRSVVVSFVVGHPQKLIDYAYRANHEMTVKAKAIVIERPRVRRAESPPGRLRMKHLAASGLWVLVLSGSAIGEGTAPAVSCESLAKLTLPDTAITMAQTVAAGAFKMPEGAQRSPGGVLPPTPAFCRVAATLKPSRDSSIRMEAWLPLSSWNGKFWGEGNGGFGGRVGYRGLVEAVRRGYAAAGCDAGHDSSKPEEDEGKFLLGHPEKLIDYGHRAIHLMTVRGKELVNAFYGAPPRHAYFFGYSLGGYQSITEARRYPEDYDGISSGKPIPSFVLFNAEQLWPAWLISRDPAKFIPREKYAVIQDAVMSRCDALDGVKDGQITEPHHCPFDPGELAVQGRGWDPAA